MPKALDLTGQRFGRLVAISKASSRSGKTYWLCQCDCGNQKEIQTSHLTDGRTLSCGCLQKEKNILTTNQNEIRRCVICGKKFIPNNYKRIYCEDCVPAGISNIESAKIRARLLKHKLIEYKGGKCEKCGYNKCEGALQFHHLNPTEKDFTISSKNLGLTDIQEFYNEVDKCILVCANCHAEIHWTN